MQAIIACIHWMQAISILILNAFIWTKLNSLHWMQAIIFVQWMQAIIFCIHWMQAIIFCSLNAGYQNMIACIEQNMIACTEQNMIACIQWSKYDSLHSVNRICYHILFTECRLWYFVHWMQAMIACIQWTICMIAYHSVNKRW